MLSIRLVLTKDFFEKDPISNHVYLISFFPLGPQTRENETKCYKFTFLSKVLPINQ